MSVLLYVSITSCIILSPPVVMLALMVLVVKPTLLGDTNPASTFVP